jgi:hypothetical protein
MIVLLFKPAITLALAVVYYVLIVKGAQLLTHCGQLACRAARSRQGLNNKRLVRTR